MKRTISLTLCLMFMLAMLAACGDNGGANNTQDNSSGGTTGSVTLESMKTAASDAGYEVSDDFTKWNNNVVGGFSVRFVSDECDIVSPVYEMKDNASAEAYAKEINDAGYQVAFVNGSFLSMASAQEGVIESEGEKAFFENLIFGKELAKATE